MLSPLQLVIATPRIYMLKQRIAEMFLFCS